MRSSRQLICTVLRASATVLSLGSGWAAAAEGGGRPHIGLVLAGGGAKGGAHALFTAETLWRLVGRDERWENTIDYVLAQHRGYLQQGVLSCDVFQPEFLQYMPVIFR